MALTDTEVAIMRALAAARGLPIPMPALSGKSEEQIMEAIEGLQHRRYVRVVGPPNANSLIGQDVDELHLRPFGFDYLRTLRP
jgi:tRNA A-37 threonylcarbamoyl transferase component Bud32